MLTINLVINNISCLDYLIGALARYEDWLCYAYPPIAQFCSFCSVVRSKHNWLFSSPAPLLWPFQPFFFSSIPVPHRSSLPLPHLTNVPYTFFPLSPTPLFSSTSALFSTFFRCGLLEEWLIGVVVLWFYWLFFLFMGFSIPFTQCTFNLLLPHT